MMGTQDAPAQLFYDFDLEQHVPAEHMLREIDRCLDMDGMQEALRPFYSSLGRPSIDPELIIMLVIGYVMGIRSERRLCDEAHLNLAYRWFWRLDLEGKVLDHSTFSRYRHGKFRDSDLLRKVFEDEPSTPLMADKVSLSSPFRPSNTILIFSSTEYCLRVARQIARRFRSTALRGKCCIEGIRFSPSRLNPPQGHEKWEPVFVFRPEATMGYGSAPHG